MTKISALHIKYQNNHARYIYILAQSIVLLEDWI